MSMTKDRVPLQKFPLLDSQIAPDLSQQRTGNKTKTGGFTRRETPSSALPVHREALAHAVVAQVDEVAQAAARDPEGALEFLRGHSGAKGKKSVRSRFLKPNVSIGKTQERMKD